MKRVMIFFLIGSGLLGCETIKDDISGESEMGGKLYIQNPYDEEVKQLISDHLVYLRDDTTQGVTSYLYYSKSDKDGHFAFNYIYGASSYLVHADTTSKTRLDENVLYSADTILAPSDKIDLIMTPDFKKQNGIYFICQDGLNPAGTIPEVNIYVYTSKLLAQHDMDEIKGEGAAYHFNSRGNGTALKINLPYNTMLYFNTIATFGNLKLKSQMDQWQLEKFGLDTVKLILKP